MPDITMCASKECPEKECYLRDLEPSQHQSYANFFIDGQCVLKDRKKVGGEE